MKSGEPLLTDSTDLLLLTTLGLTLAVLLLLLILTGITALFLDSAMWW